MATAFEVEVKNGVGACKILSSSVASIATGVKTHASNYDNACKLLYTSEDEIKDLKEKVKAAKDPKAPAELKKWEDNHPKIAARVKPAFAECEKLRAGVVQAKKALITIEGTLTTLNKTAARASMADIKATAADLKAMGTSLAVSDKEIKRLGVVLENCSPFPKTL